MSILITALLVVYTIICVLMILVVLMQRPRSEGLGAAFGGGVTENLFGAQTTNVLQKFTVWLGIAFFVLTLVLAMLYARTSNISPSLQKQLMQPGEAETSEAAPAAVQEETSIKSLGEPMKAASEEPAPASVEETQVEVVETETVDATAPAPAAEAEQPAPASEEVNTTEPSQDSATQTP